MSIARTCGVTLIVALTAGSISIAAQIKESAPPVLPGQTEGEFTIKNFHFKSGAVLPELRLHYVTLGTPHRNSAGDIDNAVLLLHATGGGSTTLLSHILGVLNGNSVAQPVISFRAVPPESRDCRSTFSNPNPTPNTIARNVFTALDTL